MRKSIAIVGLFAAMLFTAACGGGSTDVVESGTYEGTIQEVNPDESEIYVETEDNGTLELYFIEETQLTKNGQEVPFDSLQTDQQVRVEVEKVGQRLDPLSVEILD